MSVEPSSSVAVALDITNPDIPQREASDPSSSVWVSASAGSGKTKVLTDRVLRLLLPLSAEQGGADPSRILCLTFTKAAASEMMLRISETLSDWAVMGEEKLSSDLEKLFGREPFAYEVQAARRLFAQTIDVAGGLKIMTVHAFCQSVLSRFPLEAGIHPNFTVLEERETGQILRHAVQFVTADVTCEESFQVVASCVNDDQFQGLLQNFASERYQLRRIVQEHSDVRGVYDALCTALGIVAGQSPEDVLRQYCDEGCFDREGLKRSADALVGSKSKTDIARGDGIHHWLSLSLDERVAQFDSYQLHYLKQDGDVRKTLATKAVQARDPSVLDCLTVEAERLCGLRDQLNAALCADHSFHLMQLVERILARYDDLKTARNALDFDDLILKTLALMQKSPSWVMYKLDQGVEHILIDEAQDTNPEQWQIIDALCSEFYAGVGAQEAERARTIFTVGDEKQSIYSFQRASPQEFERMRGDFRMKIHQAEQMWRDVSLNVSFRSVPSVLQAVDAVFAPEHMRSGLGDAPVTHQSFRGSQAGLVEVWPLCEGDEEAPDLDPWAPPVRVKSYQSGMVQLCEQIADQIEGWLTEGQRLSSHDRAIAPRDIMILVRSRGLFVRQLSQILKARNIPIGGADRLVLNDEIAVQDLLALAAFALCPLDDLTLACVLKSPLVGLDEAALYDIARSRFHDGKPEGSLWGALQGSSYQGVYDYLSGVIEKAALLKPYGFLCFVLQGACPADEVSGLRAFQRRLGLDVMDVLSEIQTVALAYERDHTASLQGFVHWQRAENREIKREMSEAEDHVRIMTVHGSKGLQAPIVILPDTVRMVRSPGARADARLLWPDQSGFPYPLWAPWKDAECQAFRDAQSVIEARAEEEYRRLLYVAMTRAEDRLYIGGYVGKRKPLEESWHSYIVAGLSGLAHVQKGADGTLRLENAQKGPPDRALNFERALETVPDLPACLYQRVPQEQSAGGVVNPSRLLATDSSVRVPSFAPSGRNRFRRGNVTHKLLQFLPDLPAAKRREAAVHYMERFADDVSMDVVDEVFAVLEDEIFGRIFGEGSMAEVSVTARLPDGSLMSGQIDRLLITDDKILIVDYKTNRSPPEDKADIPESYRAQLQAYGDAMAQIYPGRVIKKALLWTDGLRFMEIES